MFFLLLALLGVAVAGYYDVKYRIIPNWLSFSLFLIGGIGNLLQGNTKSLLASVGATFLIGYSFWKLGVWAAGDAKEFLFLSALLPAYPEELRQVFNPYIAPYPFPITILINTFLVSFPLILVYALYLTAKKIKIEISAEKIKESLKNSLSLGYSAVFMASLLFILSALKLGSLLGIAGFYLSVPLVLLASFYMKNLKLKSGVAFLGFIFSIYLSSLATFLMSSALIFIAMVLFKAFWNSITFLSRYGLCEEIKAENLKEGMILAEEIYVEKEAKSSGNKVAMEENIYKRIKGGKDVIAASAARGLEKEEIERIKALANEGKIKNIKIKKSMALAPVLFGLGISLILGDIAAMRVLK